ncbi:DNA polymerase I A, chloroplastic/mitochondrial, partial [Frankliniella fusca]
RALPGEVATAATAASTGSTTPRIPSLLSIAAFPEKGHPVGDDLSTEKKGQKFFRPKLVISEQSSTRPVAHKMQERLVRTCAARCDRIASYSSDMY